jgi:hypothetical protein
MAELYGTHFFFMNHQRLFGGMNNNRSCTSNHCVEKNTLHRSTLYDNVVDGMDNP